MKQPDQAALAELVAFARVEVDTHDLEPWAEVLRDLRIRGVLDDEATLWVVKLYNAYDDLGSAWRAYMRWPTPTAWVNADDWHDIGDYPCGRERRGLRGGRIVLHLDSYVAWLGYLDPPNTLSQRAWVDLPIGGNGNDFGRLIRHLRQVWGVGRQTAFEWAEFLAKVADVPVHAPHGYLWESTGPRRSLQRLFNDPAPSERTLDYYAHRVMYSLMRHDLHLPWEDFETVICDFNVMRDGRYYPGKHLDMLRGEIDTLPEPGRTTLAESFARVIPRSTP